MATERHRATVTNPNSAEAINDQASKVEAENRLLKAQIEQNDLKAKLGGLKEGQVPLNESLADRVHSN